MAASLDANALHGRPRPPSRRQDRLAYCIRLVVAAVFAITGACVCYSILTEADDFPMDSLPMVNSLTDDQPHRRRHHRQYDAALSWLPHEYSKRFMAFYAPKVRAVRDLGEQALDLLWACEDVRTAVDFTVALIVVASLFRLVETWRLAAVGKLRTTSSEEAPASEDLSATTERLAAELQHD